MLVFFFLWWWWLQLLNIKKYFAFLLQDYCHFQRQKYVTWESAETRHQSTLWSVCETQTTQSFSKTFLENNISESVSQEAKEKT